MLKYSTAACPQASGQSLLIEGKRNLDTVPSKTSTHFTTNFTRSAFKMTKFIAAFEDFFKSIYELFASIIGTFASLINTLITTVVNFFSGVVNLFLDVGKGAVDLVGGIGKFIAGKSSTIII
jgi:phage-related protein